jgi:hypothetical protein
VTNHLPHVERHRASSDDRYQFSLRDLFILVTASAFTCFLLTQALGNALLVVLLTILLFTIVPLVITDLMIRTAKLMVYVLDLFTDPEILRIVSPFKRFRR